MATEAMPALSSRLGRQRQLELPLAVDACQWAVRCAIADTSSTRTARRDCTVAEARVYALLPKSWAATWVHEVAQSNDGVCVDADAI